MPSVDIIDRNLARMRDQGASKEEMRAYYDFALKQSQEQMKSISAAKRQEQADVDYESGVPMPKLRYRLGAADTPKEKAFNLDALIGPGMWRQDKAGRYIVETEGLERLGIQHEGRPRAIDERRFTPLDVVDIGGDLPTVAGAVAGGAVGGPMGVLPGMALAGGGAALGKGLQETGERIAGVETQPTGEVVRQIATEGAMGAAGEALARGGMAVGRGLLAPKRRKVAPEAKGLLRGAERIGARPAATAVTRAPIMGRLQAMMDNIFGDPRVVRNARALRAERDRLREAVGGEPKTSKELGETVRESVLSARDKVDDWAESAYLGVHEMAGGAPVIPSAPIREMAESIIRDLPTTVGEEGIEQPLLVGEVGAQLRRMTQLSEHLTVAQLQNLRNMIRGKGLPEFKNLDSAHIRQLYNATRDAVDEISNPDLSGVLRGVDAKYADEIAQFSDSFLKRIIKEPGQGGATSEEIAELLLRRKGGAGKQRAVMMHLPTETQKEVRRKGMEQIISKALTRDRELPNQWVFNGETFLKELDRYDRDALENMFGKKLTSEMFEFGEVAQFAAQKMRAAAGQLVAANIALHPIAKFPKLAYLRGLSALFESKPGFKWLTEGFKAPASVGKPAAGLTRFYTQLETLAREEQ